MFKHAVESLTRYMKLRAIDAVAVFQPANDESMDDEIAFTTADGTSRYPVAIQLSGSTCSVVTYELDAAGEVCGASHGLLHTFTSPDGSEVKYEAWQALRDNPPVPVRSETPVPRP